MIVPDAAVEIAARHRHEALNGEGSWGRAAEHLRVRMRGGMRAALRAALPYLSPRPDAEVGEQIAQAIGEVLADYDGSVDQRLADGWRGGMQRAQDIARSFTPAPAPVDDREALVAVQAVAAYVEGLDGFYSEDETPDDVLDNVDGSSTSPALRLSDIRLLLVAAGYVKGGQA